MTDVRVPTSGDDWTELTELPLVAGTVYDWTVRPGCGAVVLFSGTARDHSEGRPDVTLLEYEAYEAEVVPRLEAIVVDLRTRWPDLGRVALVHRVGEVPVGESSVLVAASAPHREAAFLAARRGIDALKATVPIWKREHWSGGSDWAQQCSHVSDLPTAETSR